jgi:antitoxin CptB
LLTFIKIVKLNNDSAGNKVAKLENSTSVIKVNKARLKWACRRGMLELDVLFMSFVDEAYDGLTSEQQFIFERLLTCQDPELFAWFMGHQVCEDSELNEMVNIILKRVKV